MDACVEEPGVEKRVQILVQRTHGLGLGLHVVGQALPHTLLFQQPYGGLGAEYGGERHVTSIFSGSETSGRAARRRGPRGGRRSI